MNCLADRALTIHVMLPPSDNSFTLSSLSFDLGETMHNRCKYCSRRKYWSNSRGKENGAKISVGLLSDVVIACERAKGEDFNYGRWEILAKKSSSSSSSSSWVDLHLSMIDNLTVTTYYVAWVRERKCEYFVAKVVSQSLAQTDNLWLYSLHWAMCVLWYYIVKQRRDWKSRNYSLRVNRSQDNINAPIREAKNQSNATNPNRIDLKYVPSVWALFLFFGSRR